MGKYVIKRLISAVPTIIGVFVVVFFIIRMVPGDPAVTMLGPGATDAQIEVYRAKYGLNEPMAVQFGIAFKNFVLLDFGNSISLHKPVALAVGERLPKTAELAVYGILISSVLAVLLGVAASIYRGKWPDLLLISFATLGMSLPTFYIGLWILLVFASKLGWIPVISNISGNAAHWQTLFGPLLTMVIGETALLLRTTRSSMLEVLDEDFIRTARAKGMPERIVQLRHALGNALIPIVTVIGYSLATAFGGAIVLETVFTRDGIGKLLIDAINSRDYALVQGTATVIAVLMIAINIVTDVVYGFVDPRIRFDGEKGA